jgi:hypothetical protein
MVKLVVCLSGLLVPFSSELKIKCLRFFGWELIEENEVLFPVFLSPLLVPVLGLLDQGPSPTGNNA